MNKSQNSRNKIYPMDCVEGMRKHLKEGEVGVVVTSPPYNIGIHYNSYHDRKSGKDYLEWLGEVAEQVNRVLSPDGSFFLNFGNLPKNQWKAWDVATVIRNHFELQNTIHWIKSIAVPEEHINIGHYKPINSKFYVHDCHEYIFHFTKTGRVPMERSAVGVPYKDKSNIGRYSGEDLRGRGSTWFIPYKTVQSSKPHPAAFPLKLPEMCIKFHGLSKVGLVLDPFMGVGTTALAAKGLGVDYVGFEIDKTYVKEAEKLLEREDSKMPLVFNP